MIVSCCVAFDAAGRKAVKQIRKQAHKTLTQWKTFPSQEKNINLAPF